MSVVSDLPMACLWHGSHMLLLAVCCLVSNKRLQFGIIKQPENIIWGEMRKIIRNFNSFTRYLHCKKTNCEAIAYAISNFYGRFLLHKTSFDLFIFLTKWLLKQTHICTHVAVWISGTEECMTQEYSHALVWVLKANFVEIPWQARLAVELFS